MADLLRGLVWAGSAAALALGVHAAVNRRRLSQLAEPAGVVDLPVSVLVPARDEATTIGSCVGRLRAQTGVRDLEVLVLDDHSGDGTADVAEQAAASDARIRVIRSDAEPPPGWLGKPFACARLAEAATGSVLVFLDADVALEPGAVAAAVAALGEGGDDLLSAWPRQIARTPLARLVQPLQQWSWLSTLPLHLTRESPRESLAAANGQFLVVSAAGYSAAGGHAAAPAAVLDDLALARTVKRAGLQVGIADASQVASCEMYRSDQDLVAGYAKSLWTAFGGPHRGLLLAAGLALIFLLPPGYAVLGRHRATRRAAAVGYGAGVAGRIVAAQASGGRVWPDAWCHPLSITAFGGLMVTSVLRRRSVRWKGRPVVAVGTEGASR